MIKHYLKIALRNLLKHKGHTFINITGLALSITASIILFLFIHHELSIDNYHANQDSIYRLCADIKIGSTEFKSASSNALSADYIRSNYPEVLDAARFGRKQSVSGNYDNRDFRITRMRYTDNSVFNIFSFPLLEGDKNTVLSEPFTIVITESIAKSIFGETNPLGEVLNFNNGESYTVTGVMKDFPEMSTMNYNAFCSFQTLYTQSPLPKKLTEITSFNFTTFLLLKKDVDYTDVERKTSMLLHEQAGESLSASGKSEILFLQPLRDIYLRPLNTAIGPIHYVYIFSAVVALILFLACINFMNLSTARSINRALEVGLRKTFGSDKKSLVIQFLSESVALSFLAMLIAFGLSLLVLPQIESLTGRDLGINLLGIAWLIPGIIAFTLLVGLLAGSYPSFVLSSFKPITVMKSSRLSTGTAVSKIRKYLVVFQFIISVTLLIGTGIIIKQLNFLKDRDPGFKKEHVLIIPMYDEKTNTMKEVIKETFKNTSGVVNVGLSSTIPGWGCPSNDKLPEGFTKENTQLMDEISVDEDFISTMGMKIIAGRNFSSQYPNDAYKSVIVNEKAVKQFGWEQPIGKTIRSIDITTAPNFELTDMTVIGVIKDYNQREVTEGIIPLFIANYKDSPFSYHNLSFLTVRILPNNISETIAKLENYWKSTINHSPFQYYFLDEEFNSQFRDIENSRDIYSYFAFLAIVIACLGLFGLASFSAQQRRKEIGIRKVLGGTSKNIVFLLSKELMVLVLIASFVAWPVTYLLLDNWLVNFPYRTDLTVFTFLSYTILVFVVGWLTIAFQTVKASLANPVDSLRNE